MTKSLSIATAAPYPGLRPFRREETDIFFGREKQSDELLEKLGRCRFLAVVGPSGCGKSSLVRAGMIAGLETGFVQSAGPRWRIAELRPGEHPLKRLANALAQPSALGPERGDDEEAAAFLRAALRRGPLGLVEVLRETPLPNRTNLLVLVDQFEENFRFHEDSSGNGRRDEAGAFVSLLLHSVAQQEVPIYVVLTMRSDFLGHCAMFSGLPEAINDSQYLTPRLTRDQRGAAITGPARVFGGDVEPALVNRLLNDTAADPDALPLMQHVLMRMWTRATGGEDGQAVLTLDDYSAVGTLANALSMHADEAYDELGANQRRVAEMLFRSLTERGPEHHDTRRPVALEDVAAVANARHEQVEEVVEAFRCPGRSFITPGVPEPIYPNTTLDLSHESLIRCWKRLSEWVETEARSAWNYRRLKETAGLWENGKESLLRSPALQVFLEWRQKQNPTPGWASRYGGKFELTTKFLDSSERAYIDEQREAEERRANEEEQRRKMAVLEALVEPRRKLAEANKDLAAAYASLDWRAKLLGILAVVAVVIALFAVTQMVRANNESAAARRNELTADSLRRVATSRGLTNAALYNLDRDVGLSTLLALAALDTTWSQPLPEAATALRRAVRFGISLTLAGHTDAVNAVAFSPEDHRLASASGDRTVRVWDATTGDSLFALEGHTDAVRDVAFSPDGNWLATASRDRTARIWNARTGGPQMVLRDVAELTDVAFSPDGRSVATASVNWTVAVWDLEQADADRRRRTLMHPGRISDVVFSPDGSRIVTGSDSGTTRIWDVRTGRLLGRLVHTSPITVVAFSPDGTHIGTGSADGVTRIWDVRTATVTDSLDAYAGRVTGVTFSPDGRQLATGHLDGAARVWELDESRPGRELRLLRHGAAITGVAFSSDGTRIAVGGFDGTSRVWEVAVGGELRTVRGHMGWVRSVAFHPDSQWIATASFDSTVRIWNATSGVSMHTLRGHLHRVYDVAFTPAGTRLATASADGTIRIWDAFSGDSLRTLHGHMGWVRGVAFHPDGRRLASASTDRTARVWDVETGDSILTLIGHTQPVRDVAFAPDRNVLATASIDSTVRLWDAETGDSLQTLVGHHREVTSVAFSPKGGLIATAGYDSTVRVWDAQTGAPKFSLTGHAGVVWDVAFNPDSDVIQLATVSRDGTARVWDLDEAPGNQLLYSLRDHTYWVLGAAFSKTGRLATASADRTARIYAFDVESLKKIAHARLERAKRWFSETECRQYLDESFLEQCQIPPW